MKFVNYLNEGRTKTINADEAFSKITDNCSRNYKKLFNSIKSIKIYRGVEFYDDFGYVNSNKGKIRKSANTDNYYTLLIDNLPSWKNYPKRSKGLVCSTDAEYTSNYGNEFYVIPFDNAKIGVCPSFDFWESFHNKEFWKYFSDLDDFVVALNWVMDELNINIIPKTFEQLKDLLIKISKTIKLSPNKEIFDEDEWEFFDQKDIMKHLNKVLDPNKNGFKMGIENLKKEREVWIQGESLLISYHGKSMLREDLQNYFWG